MNCIVANSLKFPGTKALHRVLLFIEIGASDWTMARCFPDPDFYFWNVQLKSMTDSEHGFTQVTAVASEYEMSHHQVYPTDQDALRSKGSDGQAE